MFDFDIISINIYVYQKTYSSLFTSKSPQPGIRTDHENDKQNMQRRAKRNQNPEFPLGRLMMKRIHSNQRTGAAAQKSYQKQGFLRYSVLMPDRFFLVDSIYKDRNYIYNEIINDCHK